MQVVEWVLGNVRSAWTDPQWQQHVASPAAFLKRYMPVEHGLNGSPEVHAAFSSTSHPRVESDFEDDLPPVIAS